MAKKRDLVSIEDFESEYGAETMDRVLMEHLLVEREQARRFRRIEDVLSKGGATIEQVREIVESESE